ncbi:MAG: hypothetical protein V4850_04585 [Myxococcota bacterium]
MRDTRLRVGIAGEDSAHRLLIRWLADGATRHRLHSTHATWPEPDGLDDARIFVGLEPDTDFFDTSDATARVRALAVPSGRPFYRSRRLGGAPMEDAAVFSDTLLLFQWAKQPVDALIVLADADADPGRRDAAERAMAVATPDAIVAIFGVCGPIAEAWLVALVGAGAAYRPRRTQLKAQLRFDPVTEPDRLTGQPRTAAHHAKRALAFLLDESYDEVLRYPADTPPQAVTAPALAAARFDVAQLSSLDGTGLAQFSGVLLARYAPAVTSGPQPR